MRAAAHALGSVPRAALALPPAWRRRILATLLALFVLLCGYWFWFRDSSFARVHDVYVTGVAGPQARSIRDALENAGVEQSTLHVRMSDLRQAVAAYPIVRSITAQGQFPHKLMIEVDLNVPVGILQTPSGRMPVAADGLVMRDVPVTGGLPVITTKAALPTERVTGGQAFDLIRVVSLAPDPLRPRIKSVSVRPGVGIVAQLRQGPELRFGDASRLPAKWMAAARVLAAAGARGATYIDLRLPERPAAGGLPTTSVIPLAPAGDPAATPAPAPTTTATATTPTATSTAQATTPAATTTTPAPAQTTPAQTTPTTTTQPAASPTTGGAVQAPQNAQP